MAASGVHPCLAVATQGASTRSLALVLIFNHRRLQEQTKMVLLDFYSRETPGFTSLVSIVVTELCMMATPVLLALILRLRRVW